VAPSAIKPNAAPSRKRVLLITGPQLGAKNRHKTVAYTPVLRRRYNILAFKKR
jgi:hypothetical protein